MPFIRRSQTSLSPAELSAIEGVVIIDLPPPGGVQAAGSGVACVVGEFADMTYAVAVDSSGVVTTDPRPVAIYSAQDLINKVGGFDETLGDFGLTLGNGYAEVVGKQYQSLVVVPVNLASSRGIRLWRELPPNNAAAQPVVPMQAGYVAAGRQFVNGSARVKVAAAVSFAASLPRSSGTDGSTTNAASAVTHNFDRAAGSFITDGVLEGDALVMGTSFTPTGAGPHGNSTAGTYRVVSVTSATRIVVERQDGVAFDFTTVAGTVPWRIHPGAAADSGPLNQLSEAGGFVVPARPLDSTVAAASALTPSTVPTAATATTWDTLSGLTGQTMPGGTALVFDTNVQAPNAVLHSSLAALYSTAIATLSNESDPARQVNFAWCARKSTAAVTTIVSALKQWALTASATGKGRTAIVSPPLGSSADTVTEIIGSTWPGVGDTTVSRDERVWYAWPGAKVYVKEAVGLTIDTSDASTTTDGVLDTTADSLLAAVCSQLAPERNPAQSSPPATTALVAVLGFARGTPNLGMNEYIALRQAGVVALRQDPNVGFTFQSGITTSLVAGQKNINRRRMADFIQDSCANALTGFSKLPLTDDLKDTMVAEVLQFLEGLKSSNSPPNQRIVDYLVDPDSGNTPELEAAGIYVIIVKVRTLATADFIVFQTQVGEGVVTTVSGA
jgi:hypothetical protein